ncbi:hypothetical protein ADL22_16285 [Streptomyces sp. NRRL F-4489]|uniref:peptidoglycan-binding domain-containing protein n=1 Tax=Streptomyces sp. NRRL F-4489 TaxID=1609095 RepID=UPI00074A8E6B|nr:peptidoglycan-binding domain-containing protein [Streptomyces sp. NRRL F-4489]KUL38827.1 hypothetical protein ADL22_16285 [Streptomyces sp. NRRL F-4489]
MAAATGADSGGQPPAAALAELLRSWWENSARDGRAKPTQQALAGQLGVDQATLSRYLNPRHPSTAPWPVIERLHTRLRAPAGELARARALYEAARGEAARAGSGPGPGLRERAASGRAPTEVRAAAATPPTTRRRRPVAALLLSSAACLVAGMVVWWALSPSADRIGPDTPAAAAAEPRWKLVQEGDRYWRAWTVQYLLAAHGYDVEPDGIYGRETVAAVKAFQTSRGLLADGKVGPLTWPLLVTRVDATAYGPAVRAVQNLLTNAGHPTDITGRFTAATGHALRTFQRDHRLPATGEADELTWRTLMAAQPPPVRSERATGQEG